MSNNKKFSVVSYCTEISSTGPWKTKSGGNLTVLYQIPHPDLMNFLSYDREELNSIPADIRGLRQYNIKNIKKGSIGGNEFHKIRKELIFSNKGSFELCLGDLYGYSEIITIDEGEGVYVPNFIMHSYKTVEDGDLLVLANTLFFPEDSRTHDTYTIEEFDKLRNRIK